jgi:two-component system NtrC family sensor kinase
VDLEGRFALLLLSLLVGGAFAYLALDARYPNMLLAIVVAVGVGAAASGIAHYALFRPLRGLVVMAKAVGSGDFSKRLRLARTDDIGRLALEMDTMCDQLQAAQVASQAHIAALEQLRHSERVATLGRLASSVAHELGNPLNVIELRAQLITNGDVDTLGQAKQGALVIVEQTRRMARIIDEILSFARVQPTKMAQLDLKSVLRKAIALCEYTSAKHKATVRLKVPSEAIEINGDADTLLQVIVNLVINGVQSMPRGGTLSVEASDVQRAPIEDPEGTPRDFVCIDITDHGSGIPEDALLKVFQPFFSTKAATGGTGLGLSVAQGIANDHDGWISATSELGRGSSFKVFLPMLQPRDAGGVVPRGL